MSDQPDTTKTPENTDAGGVLPPPKFEAQPDPADAQDPQPPEPKNPEQAC